MLLRLESYLQRDSICLWLLLSESKSVLEIRHCELGKEGPNLKVVVAPFKPIVPPYLVVELCLQCRLPMQACCSDLIRQPAHQLVNDVDRGRGHMNEVLHSEVVAVTEPTDKNRAYETGKRFVSPAVVANERIYIVPRLLNHAKDKPY